MAKTQKYLSSLSVSVQAKTADRAMEKLNKAKIALKALGITVEHVRWPVTPRK